MECFTLNEIENQNHSFISKMNLILLGILFTKLNLPKMNDVLLCHIHSGTKNLIC